MEIRASTHSDTCEFEHQTAPMTLILCLFIEAFYLFCSSCREGHDTVHSTNLYALQCMGADQYAE